MNRKEHMTDFKSELRKIQINGLSKIQVAAINEYGGSIEKEDELLIEETATKQVDDIIALFISKLPKEQNENSFDEDYINGWNNCLADIKGEIDGNSIH
jgi:hypothetical protein